MTNPTLPRVPDRVRWAIEQLALRPADRVLEIGSGPGLAIALALEHLTRGSITGIDRSPLQVKKARTLNRAALAAGRAKLERLSLEQAPEVLGRGGFTKVFAINVNAFWTTPGPSLATLRQLLRRRGRAHLIYETPGSAKLRELARALPPLLEQAGFVEVESREPAPPLERLICISATV